MPKTIPSDARITDPYLLQQLEDEREARGDSTVTKTAGRLITERLAQLELNRRSDSADNRRPETSVMGNQPISENDARNPVARAGSAA